MDQPIVQYLNFLGDVNDNSVRAVIGTCSLLLNEPPKNVPRQIEKPDVLYFLISSRGGLIDPGITLYNFLKTLPVEIVMHNNGSVDSIANVIFLAGTKRYAFPKSSFLFHGSTWHFHSGLVEGVDISRPQLSEALSSLTSGESLMHSIITENTSLTASEVDSLFLNGAKETVDFALSKGIIHEIKELRLPPEARIFTIPDK